jgi:8-oxo-dGTP diphosphatase
VKSIICTAGIIRRGDRILIAQRKPDSMLEPLKWEFPGGKIEFSEDPRACLLREVREEMDFDIDVKDIFDVASHNYRKNGETYHVLLLCYHCDYSGGEPRPVDCNDLRWVGRNDIEDYEFAAADVPVVKKIMTELWGEG